MLPDKCSINHALRNNLLLKFCKIEKLESEWAF